MDNFKQLLLPVKTLIFDVDGVMTDGTVLVTSDNEMLRTMNVKDGFALQLAVRKGYRIVIISGGNCVGVRSRFTLLGVEDIFLGISNKLEVFEDYARMKEILPEEVLYMGDDLPDYQVMTRVGIPVCPADAAEEIKSVSKYISSFKGGEGCVRDVIEQVMKVHGAWFNDDGFHW
ncbi:MAG TPA: HAD-IIIA family hydrolase [Bacteroidales bacterium]|nr:HAD-IIIA family hydrolase [Bacteroidales bacterium]